MEERQSQSTHPQFNQHTGRVQHLPSVSEHVLFIGTQAYLYIMHRQDEGNSGRKSQCEVLTQCHI